MTRPIPLDGGLTDDFKVLRKRWIQRYLGVQSRTDIRTRTALISAANDAYQNLLELEQGTTFSAKVRSAQLRITTQIVQEVLNDFFKKELVLIQDGQKESAKAAVTAFGETDRDYLSKAFSDTQKLIQTWNPLSEDNPFKPNSPLQISLAG